MDSNELINRNFKASGVIVLHEQESDSLILTQRSEKLRAHPGEICFPGGRWEEGDANYYVTALRELEEELGVSAARVTLLKELKTEKTLLGNIIHPWLAHIKSIYPYYLNEEEVVRLISIPLTLVQDPRNYRAFRIQRNGRYHETWEFIGNKEGVWGATARIMRQLIKIE